MEPEDPLPYSEPERATGWTAGARFPARTRVFSLLHSVHTGSRAHPASYPMGTGALSLEIKLAGREADHSSPYSVEVKNGGAMPLLPHMSSWNST
jgi:hypothetical protein